MDIQPLEALRSSGVLWAVNRALHPRGFALALALDDDGKVTGWTLVGNGTAPMAFDARDDADGFAAFEATIANARLGSEYVATQPPPAPVKAEPELQAFIGAESQSRTLAGVVVPFARIDPPKFFAAGAGGGAIVGEY